MHGLTVTDVDGNVVSGRDHDVTGLCLGCGDHRTELVEALHTHIVTTVETAGGQPCGSESVLHHIGAVKSRDTKLRHGTSNNGFLHIAGSGDRNVRAVICVVTFAISFLAATAVGNGFRSVKLSCHCDGLGVEAFDRSELLGISHKRLGIY